MAYANKQDQKDYAHAHYLNNKGDYIRRTRLHGLKHKKVIKAYIASYLLNHGCVDCPEGDPVVLEFDHRVGSRKMFNIGDAASRKVSLKRLIEEIVKCDVRCANCHRRQTHKRRLLRG